MENNSIEHIQSLHNFYDIQTYANGKFRGIKLSQPKIIEMLKAFGFFVYQLYQKKNIYIHITNNTVQEVSPLEIRRFFHAYIENLPDCPYTLHVHEKNQQGMIEQHVIISSHDILNKFLVQVNLFNKKLLTQLIPSQPIELDKDTLNHLKMENNPDDRCRINVTEIITHLLEAGFKKTVDKGSYLTTDADLYFKHVTANQYMIFTHYNHDQHIRLQGFDYWFCEFNSEREIGQKRPKQKLNSILSFQFYRDWKNIQELLEQSKQV